MTRGDAVFLDTTIQVDRVLKERSAAELAEIEGLLDLFELKFACTYSRLEFKRVILQGLNLALRYIADEGSFFRALQLATRLRRERQKSTLVNILAWVEFQIDHDIEVRRGDSTDQILAQQAIAFIRNAIEFMWHRFDASVDSVTDGTGCRRAAEGPVRKRSGDFELQIRESSCRNQSCKNADFFRSNLPRIRALCEHLEGLKAGGQQLTGELDAALGVMRHAMDEHFSALYDYDTCLAVGDVWIHLESVAAGVQNFATTNYKESSVLCPALGLEMKQP